MLHLREGNEQMPLYLVPYIRSPFLCMGMITLVSQSLSRMQDRLTQMNQAMISFDSKL